MEREEADERMQGRETTLIIAIHRGKEERGRRGRVKDVKVTGREAKLGDSREEDERKDTERKDKERRGWRQEKHN